MRQTSIPAKQPANQLESDIRRTTRRQSPAEKKIRMVLLGLQGEDSIADLCRRGGHQRTLVNLIEAIARGRPTA
jgi:transposase